MTYTDAYYVYIYIYMCTVYVWCMFVATQFFSKPPWNLRRVRAEDEDNVTSAWRPKPRRCPIGKRLHQWVGEHNQKP